MSLRPDPTFHATAKLAMQAPVENYGFTVMLSPDGSTPDGIAVIDLKENSPTYGQIVHQIIMPNKGDEFHHFGWNACSSSLSPLSGHAFSNDATLLFLVSALRASMSLMSRIRLRQRYTRPLNRKSCLKNRLFSTPYHSLRA